MTRYKNISGGPLDLVVPGFEARVEDGDIVDIPEFQPDGESPIVVPGNRWDPVKPGKPLAKDKDTKTADGKDDG